MEKKLITNYLNIVEDIIISNIHRYSYSTIQFYNKNFIKNFIKYILINIFNRNNRELVFRSSINDKQIKYGLLRSSESFSMIGRERLRNIRELIHEIKINKIDGDLIEAGIWRGGVIIYMRACLLAFNLDKKVFGADSFEGLPEIDDEKYPADKIYKKILKNGIDKGLIVQENEVLDNLNIFGFKDTKSILIKGWFEKSLYDQRIKKLSLIRIDGDMYKSTYEALKILYPKLSYGGFVVIDDYGLGSKSCKKAVDEFRLKNKIDNEIISIDWTGIYWKK